MVRDISADAEAIQLPGHLDYYLQHGLNPVRYEMSDLARHLDRRGSLYRTLGLIPQIFRNARVLEVAPGSGQNSLYIASLQPRELVLVEPNPTGQRDIKKLYADPGLPCVQPTLVESTFQNYAAAELFDVVICENWLGHSSSERAMLRKLGRLVAPSGVLTVTVITPVGILPNVLRKALTCRIDRPRTSFQERTAILVGAFESHLSTIPAMTRTCTDWVHDNVMNPAYFGILLTLPMVLDDLGREFDLLGSSPRFATDWRWFKAMYGDGREFNQHFLGEYHAALHNFLDYRRTMSTRDPARNRVLESAAWAVSQDVLALEQAVYCGTGSELQQRQAIVRGVEAIRDNIDDLHVDCREAIEEFVDVFQCERPTPDQVAGMSKFGKLFGRETMYLSLEKTRHSQG